MLVPLFQSSPLWVRFDSDGSIEAKSLWVERLFEPASLLAWRNDMAKEPGSETHRILTLSIPEWNPGHTLEVEFIVSAVAHHPEGKVSLAFEPASRTDELAVVLDNLHHDARSMIHDTNNKLATLHGVYELIRIRQSVPVDDETLKSMRQATIELSDILSGFRETKLLSMETSILLEALPVLMRKEGNQKVQSFIPNNLPTAHLAGRLTDWVELFRTLLKEGPDSESVFVFDGSQHKNRPELILLFEDEAPLSFSKDLDRFAKWLFAEILPQGRVVKILAQAH